MRVDVRHLSAVRYRDRTVGLLGAVGLLQKTFSLSELNAAIAAALQDSDQKWA